MNTHVVHWWNGLATNNISFDNLDDAERQLRHWGADSYIGVVDCLVVTRNDIIVLELRRIGNEPFSPEALKIPVPVVIEKVVIEV